MATATRNPPARALPDGNAGRARMGRAAVGPDDDPSWASWGATRLAVVLHLPPTCKGTAASASRAFE